MGWFLLGLIVGGTVVGYTTRDALSRLGDIEAQLTDVTYELQGLEGAVAGIPPRLNDVRIRLVKVADGIVDPVDAASRRGDESLYIGTRPGRIYRTTAGQKPELVLDLTPQVDDQNAKPGSGSEPGLLGMTFSPTGDRLYVTYTATWSRAERSVIWTLAEFGVEGNDIDASSTRTILTVRKVQAQHNGGAVRFGPDGYLYTSVGDGSPTVDRRRTGQDTTDLLGSILRIDPTSKTGRRPYAIPAGNPFVDNKGADEIWAFGVRNPWRFSFDRATGDLWIADPGHAQQEEIDVLRAADGGGKGANLGWSLVEGNARLHGEPPEDAVGPIYTYPHEDGYCAIIGGFVYRGSAIPALRGSYVFSDFCMGTVRALARTAEEVRVRSLGKGVTSPSSISEDSRGELYVVSLEGEVFRIAPA